MHLQRWIRALTTPAMLALAICGLGQAAGCKPEPVPPPPATAPATTQTVPSTPASEPPTQPAAATYLDVIRSAYPSVPATQPLAVPLALRDSAHLIITKPVYLDEQGHLWLTHADGNDAGKAFRETVKSGVSEHVVKEKVLFVWWLPDRAGDFVPHVIAESTGGRAEMIVPSRQLLVGLRRDYDWSRARSWVDRREQRLIVPTASGVSVFTFESDREPIAEAFQDLDDLRDTPTTNPAPASAAAALSTGPTTRARKGTASPQFLFDPRGVIAWIPVTSTSPGSNGAARFVDGKWIALTPAAGWTDRMLHLIPLRDGSVTQLLLKSASEGGGVKVALASIDAPRVNKDEILNWVDDLSDVDKDVRNRAYGRLTEYGPGIWPILREIPPDDLPPEARSRLNRLLKSQVTPMLGGMGLQGDQLRLVQRLRDGGVVFYTDQGINLPNPLGDDPVSVAPAWIAARPGYPVELLSGALVFNAVPDRTRFDFFQGQWVLTMDDVGPQQFLGNSFRKLLRKESRAFTEIVGIDRRGRWLFRTPTALEAIEGSARETLIVDPTVPDFTPRLPVWLYANADETGWDKAGWPVVKLGESRTKLIADRWAPLAESEEMLLEAPSLPGMPPPTPMLAPATLSSTGPTTRPSASATTSATRPSAPSPDRLAALGRPLMTDPSGTRYYDGTEALLQLAPDGAETRWALPPDAVGQTGADGSAVTLICGANGRLFLFNRPGRVLRINPTPAAAEPFSLEATFTRDIPENETPRHIWLDPAGRIVMALDRKLAILFIEGFIPTPIRRMMDVGDDED